MKEENNSCVCWVRTLSPSKPCGLGGLAEPCSARSGFALDRLGFAKGFRGSSQTGSLRLPEARCARRGENP